ncbi:hypothetical protein [Aliamphritea ceti]|uniref:hypothetical protein n=1 Tax=Aliamphritea ceti TaxID=1524258 RepID=UPI0021C44999|nr:hypothetical protein [Aliamphritea ceti]
MSQLLADIVEQVQHDYHAAMMTSGGENALRIAMELCNHHLYLEIDKLALVVAEDPTLLATRPGGMIADAEEAANPSVGMIICVNLAAGMLEALIGIAAEQGWLKPDAEGHLSEEVHQQLDEVIAPVVDYSDSELAKQNMQKPGRSELTKVMALAESVYQERLATEAADAYNLALEVASEYSVFAPDDIAPLVAENPLLLGLRADGMVEDEIFEGDPPAGLVISAHLTDMVMSQLMDYAVEQGALALDSSGQPIMQLSDKAPPLH